MGHKKDAHVKMNQSFTILKLLILLFLNFTIAQALFYTC